MVLSCQESPQVFRADARIVRSGQYSAWLKKMKGENAKARWLSTSTNRYFTIDFDLQVFYYSHSKSNRKTSAHVPFREIEGAERLPPPITKRGKNSQQSCGFLVRTLERSLELYTCSSQDAAQWVYALNAARDIARGKNLADSPSSSPRKPESSANRDASLASLATTTGSSAGSSDDGYRGRLHDQSSALAPPGNVRQQPLQPPRPTEATHPAVPPEPQCWDSEDQGKERTLTRQVDAHHLQRRQAQTVRGMPSPRDETPRSTMSNPATPRAELGLDAFASLDALEQSLPAQQSETPAFSTGILEGPLGKPAIAAPGKLTGIQEHLTPEASPFCMANASEQQQQKQQKQQQQQDQQQDQQQICHRRDEQSSATPASATFPAALMAPAEVLTQAERQEAPRPIRSITPAPLVPPSALPAALPAAAAVPQAAAPLVAAVTIPVKFPASKPGALPAAIPGQAKAAIAGSVAPPPPMSPSALPAAPEVAVAAASVADRKGTRTAAPPPPPAALPSAPAAVATCPPLASVPVGGSRLAAPPPPPAALPTATPAALNNAATATNIVAGGSRLGAPPPPPAALPTATPAVLDNAATNTVAGGSRLGAPPPPPAALPTATPVALDTTSTPTNGVPRGSRLAAPPPHPAALPKAATAVVAGGIPSTLPLASVPAPPAPVAPPAAPLPPPAPAANPPAVPTSNLIPAPTPASGLPSVPLPQQKQHPLLAPPCDHQEEPCDELEDASYMPLAGRAKRGEKKQPTTSLEMDASGWDSDRDEKPSVAPPPPLPVHSNVEATGGLQLANLIQCEDCGRSFNADSVEKHKRVCRKVFQQKPAQFNSAAKRLGDFVTTGELLDVGDKLEKAPERIPEGPAQIAVAPSGFDSDEEGGNGRPPASFNEGPKGGVALEFDMCDGPRKAMPKALAARLSQRSKKRSKKITLTCQNKTSDKPPCPLESSPEKERNRPSVASVENDACGAPQQAAGAASSLVAARPAEQIEHKPANEAEGELGDLLSEVLASGSDASPFQGSEIHSFVPNFHCLGCDHQVLRIDGYAWKGDVPYMFLRNNYPNAMKLRPQLRSQPGVQALCCQCSARSAEAAAVLEDVAEGLRWRTVRA